MSALGQKQTNRPGPTLGFVRYCPKADKDGGGHNVRFVPITDIAYKIFNGLTGSRL
jgi:hypothetical protein